MRRAFSRFRRSRAADRVRRLRRVRPTRKHARAALLATVPASALFGFAGTPHDGNAAAMTISAPLLDPARPVRAADPDHQLAPQATPAAVEASFYGRDFAGRPTASGETFDPGKLTAAHRTLPFGSKLKVTHAVTGKSVVVTVNDRGPFHGHREIDLSTAAASQIGMIASGTAMVTLERV